MNTLKALREYHINFGNLKLGLHRYDYEVGEEFFSHFEFSLVKNGEVQVFVFLEKQRETFFTLRFEIEGYIVLECDRCLDEFNYPIKRSHSIAVKLEEKKQESNDEIIFLPVDAYELDVSPFIYDFINLSVPMKHTHDLVGEPCNPKMLSLLNSLTSQAENEEDHPADPRWEGLRKLNRDE